MIDNELIAMDLLTQAKMIEYVADTAEDERLSIILLGIVSNLTDLIEQLHKKENHQADQLPDGRL